MTDPFATAPGGTIRVEHRGPLSGRIDVPGAKNSALKLMAASLLSWIEHIADWELARRAGDYRRLQPPAEAIPPEEHATCVVAAMMLRARFDTDPGGRSAVVELFDAVVAALNRPGAAARW